MRPDYKGIKYYGKNDMSIGWELEKVEEKLSGFSELNVPENVNEAIELFNISQLLDTEICKRKWDDITYMKYKNKVPLLMQLCAKYFSEIKSDNFKQMESEVNILYLEDFWELIDKFKVYERISKEEFKSFLEETNPTLWVILKQKRIVQYFGVELADILRSSEQTAELIAHNYLEEGEQKRYYFPKELLPSEFEEILKKYVESENPNPNYLHLIMVCSSSEECPISNNLKLLAKRAYNNFWEKSLEEGAGLEYEVELSLGDYEDVMSCEMEGRNMKYCYDVKWLKESLDYPSILNNFKFVFEYFDRVWRCTFVSVQSQLGIFQKIGVKAKREYLRGTSFNLQNWTSTMQMNLYYDFLQKNDVCLENVIKWFFEDYLIEEFGVEGFVFNASHNNASWLEKCRNIASEMDGILKQYRMYIEDGKIDRELFEMSSEHIIFDKIPSSSKQKYAYANSNDINNQMHLLFSDQSVITYTEKTESKYRSFAKLVISEEMKRTDFYEYQLSLIDWLIEKKLLFIDNNEVLRMNNERILLLSDLYKNDVLCVRYYKGLAHVINEMVSSKDLRVESTLFSTPEVNYLNYMLNKSEYCDGKDLRNKYIHSTYSNKENVQKQDYMDLLKIMIVIVGKINEEFLLKDNKLKGEENG